MAEEEKRGEPKKDLLFVDEKDPPFLLSGNNPIAKPKTAKPTRSSALDRVRAFLPTMAEANAALEKDVEENGQEKYNIESVDEGGAAIVMDLSVVTEESLRAPPSNVGDGEAAGEDAPAAEQAPADFDPR